MPRGLLRAFIRVGNHPYTPQPRKVLSRRRAQWPKPCVAVLQFVRLYAPLMQPVYLAQFIEGARSLGNNRVRVFQ